MLMGAELLPSSIRHTLESSSDVPASGACVHIAVLLMFNVWPGFGGAVRSMLANMRKSCIHIYVIVPEREEERVRQRISDSSLSKRETATFHVVPTADDSFLKAHGEHVDNPAAYAQAFLRTVLLINVPKIIYLGCNVVVQGDIRELWDLNIQGYYGAAVRKPDAGAVDAGVVIYDLEAWRRSSPNQAKQRLSRVVTTERGPPLVLATLFHNGYLPLPDEWNAVNAGDAGSASTALERAKLISYFGRNKPWLLPRRSNSEYYTRQYPDWEEDFPEERYTLVIATAAHERFRHVVSILRHVQASKYLGGVVIVWNVLDVPCPTRVLQSLVFVSLMCKEFKDKRVDNRYRIGDVVGTTAAFFHDDDVVMDVEGMDFGFKVWRRFRNQVVGFQPRMVVHENGKLVYRSHLVNGVFQVVIGKFFLTDVKYLHMYLGSAAHVELGSRSFCEDIQLNALVAEQTGLPPVLVQSGHRELPRAQQSGLSTSVPLTGWSALRSACIAEVALNIYNATFLAHLPSSNSIYTAYDAHSNTMLHRRIAHMESICSNTRGVRPCHIE